MRDISVQLLLLIEIYNVSHKNDIFLECVVSPPFALLSTPFATFYNP